MRATARFILVLTVVLAVLAVFLPLETFGVRSTAGAHAQNLTAAFRVHLPLVVNSGHSSTPTPVPTSAATASPTPSRTASPTASPTAPSTPIATASPTVSPTASPTSVSPAPLRRVNAPNFNNGAITYASTAIFWLGRVGTLESYGDVRVGYNSQKLFVSVNSIDRRLWYNTAPPTGPLTDWDAVSLYLDKDGNQGGAPGANSYRLEGQLSWWEARTNYQAAYRGNGSGWSSHAMPFTTTTLWRGNAPNDDTNDAGWRIDYEIPFSSLGLAGPPPEGTKWGFGITLHNRDYMQFPSSPDQSWPENLASARPATWGELGFGLPTFTPPSKTPVSTVTIRHGLNGAIVRDAAVGGTFGNLCGESAAGWNEWGNANYNGAPRFNIQNQDDVADWWCFSKYYVTFPLDAVPPGKVILSASLTLHEFGNSGQPNMTTPSLIQVLTVNEDWDEGTITWNNAPLARENVSQTWVDPIVNFPGWPGVPWTWDVSKAVTEAYASGQPLRLVLYEADAAMHSGKYFTGSDEPDWNAASRPTLQIIWGNP